MQYNYVAFQKSKDLKDLEEKANSYGTYTVKEGSAVDEALKKKNTYETQYKPAEWNGGNYGEQVKEAYNAYNNRKAFSYDLNGDALYQQYKDKYINQGRLAMADTIGQAAAMTGGYGSSYAVTAGNQAYQSQLQNLNDIVPQLYQMAYDRYSQEGEDLKTKYSMLNNMYQTEYGEHRDKVGDYNTELARLTDAYNTERSFDYGTWDADRNYYQTAYQNAYNREYGAWQDTQNRLYQSVRDQVADYQWSQSRTSNTAETSQFGGLTEGDFLDRMEMAAGLNDPEKAQQAAQALVISAGYSEAAMAIYDLYFGQKKQTPPQQKNSGGLAGGFQAIKEVALN